MNSNVTPQSSLHPKSPKADCMHDGDKCAMLMAPEPFLAVGAVSEHDVGSIKVGDTATATLVTGETVQGRVRFVAGTRSAFADPGHAVSGAAHSVPGAQSV